MKKLTLFLVICVMLSIEVNAQFQPDGSLKVGSLFNVYNSGRISGNMIFGYGGDANGAIVRGGSTIGLEFLTFNSNQWFNRMKIASDGTLTHGTLFNLFPSGRIKGNLIFGYGADANGAIVRGGNAIGLEFLTFYSDQWLNRMNITPEGKVGINTLDPVNDLHIDGQQASLRVGPNYSSGGDRDYIDILAHPTDTRIESDNEKFHIQNNSGTLVLQGDGGSVAIGTEIHGSHRLAVEGSIGAREIVIEASTWSDFVFEEAYQLKSLEEVEEYIDAEGHLPEIPSEKEVLKQGIHVAEMNVKLLQKIEELTLYLIEQNKEIKEQRKLIEDLQNQIKP